jgi:hypothetical protein
MRGMEYFSFSFLRGGLWPGLLGKACATTKKGAMKKDF